MKHLRIRPAQILRAIRNACMALLLLAVAQRAASAQSYTAPFVVTGGTVTTSAGSYSTGSGLDEGGANYSSFTIGSGTTIDSTNTYAGSFPTEQSLIHTSASNFSNAGTLELNVAGIGGENPALIWLDQGALDLTFANSGSMSSAVTGGSVVQQEVYLTSTTGNVSVTNTGSIYVSQSPANYGISVNSNSGNVDITNAQSGSIICAGFGRAVNVATGGAGTINFSNAGTLTIASGETVFLVAGTGAITGTNSGSISGGDYGVYTESSGNVTFTNTSTGTMSGSSSAVYVDTANGNINLTNAGTLTNGAYGSTSNGSVTILNTGTISGGSTGILGSGTSVAITNSGMITNSNYGIYAYQNGGTTPSVQVVNSGTISATGSGIYLGGPGTVINSGPLSGGTNAINVPSGSTVILQGKVSTPNAVVSGEIVGGADATSTSRLVFNETVPGAQYGSDRATLDAEIANYEQQGGGNYTFTFAGLTFDVSNFDFDPGVVDALIGRLYVNTPGFNSMGSVLDRLNSQASTPALLNALNNLTDEAVPGALEELSPQSLQVFRNIAFDNNTFLSSELNHHLTNVRDGQAGFDASQISVKDSTMDPLLDQVRSRLLAYSPGDHPGLRTDSGPLSDTIDPVIGAVSPRDDKDEKSDVVEVKPEDPWSSFIAGDVILANLANDPNVQNADYTTGTITAGVDYRLNGHFTVGALVSYGHSAVDLDAHGSSATVDNYSAGLYASYVEGPWYGNGMACYGRNAYTEDRVIDIPGISGDNHGGTSGNQGTLNLTGGREFQKGAFKFGPVASLDYVHLNIGSINEQGPTALNISNENQDSLRTLLGVEGRYTTSVSTPLGLVVLTPHFNLNWQHEYLDSSDAITSQFNGIGGGSFTVQTDTPQRDSAFLEAGIDMGVSEGVVLFLDYAVQAGQDNYFAQSAQGGAKIGF